MDRRLEKMVADSKFKDWPEFLNAGGEITKDISVCRIMATMYGSETSKSEFYNPDIKEADLFIRYASLLVKNKKDHEKQSIFILAALVIGTGLFTGCKQGQKKPKTLPIR